MPSSKITFRSTIVNVITVSMPEKIGPYWLTDAQRKEIGHLVVGDGKDMEFATIKGVQSSLRDDSDKLEEILDRVWRRATDTQKEEFITAIDFTYGHGIPSID